MEKYIGRCIESIISQTIYDLELILIDDGSTDNSGKICDEYSLKDNRIKVIHKQNGGVSFARNIGITYAKGKYISFVDSDDYVDSNMYELLISKAKESDADQVSCGYISEFQNRKQECCHAFGNSTINGKKEVFEQLIVPLLTPNAEKAVLLQGPCNRLYRRELLVKNHILFDNTFSFAEDWLFNVNYYRYASVVSFIPDPLYHYDRTIQNSLSKKFREDGFEDAVRLRRIEKEWFPEFCTDEVFLDLVSCIWKHYIKLYAGMFGTKGLVNYAMKLYRSPSLSEAAMLGGNASKEHKLYSIIRNKNKIKYIALSIHTSLIECGKHYVKLLLR